MILFEVEEATNTDACGLERRVKGTRICPTTFDVRLNVTYYATPSTSTDIKVEVRFCNTGIVLKRMPITDLLQLVYLPMSEE